jgi:hypothetical protein
MREGSRDLLDSFDEVTIARGLRHADKGAVTMIAEREHGLIARVQGARRDPYSVHIPFGREPSAPLEPASAACIPAHADPFLKGLTAADYAVIFDPWWNPAVEREAVDRSRRIGQRKPVFVYRLITKDSIEERILALQDRKRALAADLIEENPRSLLSLGEEELVGFFS